MCIYKYIHTPYIYTTGKYACGSRGVTNELYICMYRYMDMYFYVNIYIIYLPQVYLCVGHGVSKLSFVPFSRATCKFEYCAVKQSYPCVWHTHTRTRTRTHAYTHKLTHININMYVRKYTHKLRYTHTHKHKHVYTQIHTQTQIYSHTLT